MLSGEEYLKAKVTVQSLSGLLQTTKKASGEKSKQDVVDLTDLFQQVIQLVRVSGLRPGRENVLVEQLNDLRQKTQCILQDVNDSLAHNHEVRDKQGIELQEYEEKLKTTETQLKEATCQLKVQQKNLEAQEDKLTVQEEIIQAQDDTIKALTVKVQVEEVKLKEMRKEYEQLEEKYSIQATAIVDNQAVDELIERLETDYRTILRKRAEEMKKSREQTQELKEEIRQLRVEKNGLEGIVRQVRGQYEEAHRNEIEHRSESAHMKGLYENLMKAFREQQDSYSDRLAQVEKLHQDQLRREKRQKQLELEEVETRVKVTIEKKDKVIKTLQGKLQQQENVLTEFETLREFGGSIN